MGAWGVSSFENDDALDWVYELEASSGLGVLTESLSRSVAEHIFLESPKASVIVAACEVIVAAKYESYDHLPEEVRLWLTKNTSQNYATLKDKAISALRSVLRINCELYWLWRENAEMYTEWRSGVEHLIAKLQS